MWNEVPFQLRIFQTPFSLPVFLQNTSGLGTALGFFQSKSPFLLGTPFLTPPAPAHRSPWLVALRLIQRQEGSALPLRVSPSFPRLPALCVCSGSDEVIDYPASDVLCSLQFNPAHSESQTEGRHAHERAPTHPHAPTHARETETGSDSSLDRTFQKTLPSAHNLGTVFSSGSVGEN